MRRAIFDVVVAGTNISTALAPILLSMSISDKAGTNADTATLEIDDTNGRIIMPKAKAPVFISLGWAGGGMREVFSGTVDELRSAGDRGGGRRLSISAKGVDTSGKAKEGQQRHFDDMTVKDILTEAGKLAGITQVEVDPSIADIVIPYIDMRDESLLHLGERLARDIGGNFRINGTRLVMAKRGAAYAASVIAAWGQNLHSWDIAPTIGRGRFAKTQTVAYDRKKSELVVFTSETGTEDAEATHTRRDALSDPDAAQRAADGDAANAQEKSAGGTVVIEGTTEAVPDGFCIVTGARAGVDGAYKITSVTHQVSRGGGWTTSLELAGPVNPA